MSAARTGIFFHYQQGERLRDFPGALNGILEKNNVFFFDAFYPKKPASVFDLKDVPLEAILRVHSPEMVERVKATGSYEGALYSASGTLAAGVRIASGEITNAFVFIGISPGLHMKLAVEIKRVALHVCHGKLIVVLCGGSRRDLAKMLIPQIIRILADQTV